MSYEEVPITFRITRDLKQRLERAVRRFNFRDRTSFICHVLEEKLKDPELIARERAKFHAQKLAYYQELADSYKDSDEFE